MNDKDKTAAGSDDNLNTSDADMNDKDKTAVGPDDNLNTSDADIRTRGHIGDKSGDHDNDHESDRSRGDTDAGDEWDEAETDAEDAHIDDIPFEIDDQDNIHFDEEVINQWNSDLDMISNDEMQTLLMHQFKQRIFWRIVRYLRLFPEKLVSDQNSYSDICVGGEELSRYMGYETADNYAHAWLENNHVPPLEDAERELIICNEQIRLTLEKCAQLNTVPIALIARRFALNSIELEILSTLVLTMSVESCMRMMAVAWADFSVRQPTVTFMCQLLADPVSSFDDIYRAFDENGILRRMNLIIIEKNPRYQNYTPLHFAPIAVEQCVIDAFCGNHGYGTIRETCDRKSVPFQRLIVDKNVREEIRYALKKRASRLCLIGEPHSGRRTLAESAVSHFKKMHVSEVDFCREFSRTAPENIAFKMAGLMRNALIHAGTLLLRFDDIGDCPELMAAMNSQSEHLVPLFTRYPATLVIIAREDYRFIDVIFGKPTIIRIPMPDPELSKKVWNMALSPWCSARNTEKMAEMFAGNYEIPIGQIFNIVQNVAGSVGSVKNGDPFESHRILTEIRRTFEHDLGTLADITVSDVHLEGVVLPPEAKSQVDEIIAYAKNLNNVLHHWGFIRRSPYGNALSVLFSGPPGTGKTLLACALANTLGKVLYRVDLSRIVDKYVGETEKNLAKIFNEAARAQAIILFDEADSLFAKRTNVKSSNDRYANLEINFLLQKLESYNGMTILTTNLSKSIDEAFKRRIRFIVEFPMPDAVSRQKLWKRMMPPDAPLSDDIRWSWLAGTFEMSGGYIRNAVLKAAITASSENEPIAMRHLSKAASDVARSMGKLMRIDDEAYDDYDDYDDEDDSYDDEPGYRDEDDRGY